MTSRNLYRFWRASLATLGLVALGIFIAQVLDPGLLVAVRSVLFTRYVTPSIFDSFGVGDAALRADGTALINEWRSRIQRDPALAATLIDAQRATNPVERAKILINDFSTGGAVGKNGCGAILSLAGKMKAPGCCSDHTEVFIAWAELTGISAREVSNDTHTVVEVFDPTVRKWILMDPTYQLMAYDAQKQPLSLRGVRERVLRGEPFSLVRFGKGSKATAISTKGIAEFYRDPAVFADLSLTNGINVFQEDALMNDLRPMPKTFVRLVGVLLKVTPGYLVVRDGWNETRVGRLVAIRDLFWVLLAALLLFVLSFPLFRKTDRESEPPITADRATLTDPKTGGPPREVTFEPTPIGLRGDVL